MKESQPIDTILLNRHTRTGQRIQTTAESVGHVLNAGGLPQATMLGVELKRLSNRNTKPFNEALVPLYPTVQNNPVSNN